MSKSDVMNHLGHPTRVEVAGNPSYENERWLYTRNGASNYVYFEAGHVEGWE
jgi:outer membrane protein assembly factor BamE (lipoprotein component of BamABCDE complex)